LVAFRKPQFEIIARVAETAAAIAVVLSVIYLARQISDNTKLLRSQAHFNALVLGQRPLELMIANDSLAGTVLQCGASPEHVDAAAWERCVNYFFMQFNAWEYFYYENKDDSIPRELWIGADESFKALVKAKPGYARFWSEMQGAFAEPFKSYAAQQLPRSSPVQPDQHQ
jgi:hypothetical protein